MRLGWKAFLPFSIGYLILVAGVLMGANGLVTLLLLFMKFLVKPNQLFKHRKIGNFRSCLDSKVILFFVLFPGGVVSKENLPGDVFVADPKHYKNSFIRKTLESSSIYSDFIRGNLSVLSLDMESLSKMTLKEAASLQRFVKDQNLHAILHSGSILRVDSFSFLLSAL